MNNKGFTLIETIIAIAILTVGIFSVFQIFPFIFKVTETSNHSTVASNLAQGSIETELNNAYEDIAIGEKPLTAYEAPYSNYSYQVSIGYINQNLEQAETDQGLKKIVVTVNWNERGKTKQTQLATVVNDN